MMWRMARPYLPQTLAALAVLGLAYWVGLLALKRLFSAGAGGAALSRVMKSKGLCLTGVSFILLAALGVCTVASDKAEGQAVLHLSLLDSLGQSTSSARMGREEFFKEAQTLGIGSFDLAGGTHPANPPRNLNVVLVFMESSYNQYLSLFGGNEETQPKLARYKSRMELYPNFFSNFAGSINARFAAFTSLYPARDFHAFTTQRVPVPSVFEILHQHGYACSLFYSSFLDYTGFRDFLMQRGLDQIYDADTMPGARRSEPVSWGLREEETMAAICGQIQKHAAAKERFFLTYVPAAPHYPFDCIPREFSKFKSREMGDYTPFYLNELLYMDWVLSSIVEQLERTGELDSTLVIITNDHGEMLGANGGPIGHGWCLTPELANPPLLIMDPGRPGYRLNYTVGSQVDLLPTILERLNLPLPAGQLYEGHSLDSGGPGETHKTYLNTMQQFGVLSGQRLYLGDRDVPALQAARASGGVFQIRNEGSKTVFQKDPSAPEASISIQAFDAFQENLLRNYGYYSRSVMNPEK
jgi:hypothetical protein